MDRNANSVRLRGYGYNINRVSTVSRGLPLVQSRRTFRHYITLNCSNNNDTLQPIHMGLVSTVNEK